MKRRTTKWLVSVSAVLLGLCGVALIFAPVEVGELLGIGLNGFLPISLWGGALLGFGLMNWIARHSVFGGIYGRAVVVGNQAHAFVGALVLARIAFQADLSWPIGVLLAVYLFHALLFSYLMFGASGLE
jgi:hypothetical protein